MPDGAPSHNRYFVDYQTTAGINFFTDIPGAVKWSYAHDGPGDIAPHFDLEAGRLAIPYSWFYPFHFIDCNAGQQATELYELSAFGGQLLVYATVGGQTYGPATLTFSGTVLTVVSFT